MPASRRQSARGPGPKSEIPDRLYFKIGEVAKLVGVKAHVLRYWEKEIALLRPGKTASNQRRYRRRDVEIFREIRRLLHEERYTLAGARRRVMGLERTPESASVEAPSEPVPQAPAEAPSGGQLALGFARPDESERLERVRAGLRELIRLTGDEP